MRASRTMRSAAATRIIAACTLLSMVVLAAIALTGGKADAQSAAPVSVTGNPWATSSVTNVKNPTAGAVIARASRFAIRRLRLDAPAGGRISVQGHLLPAAAGREITLVTRSGGRWATLARALTGPHGGFRLPYVVPGIGTRDLRVSFRGDRTARPAWAVAADVVGLRPAVASWYYDGGGTACGFHATYGIANKTLPCGTRVTLAYGGRTVVATVDDRGPYVAGRDYDLSQSTAGALGMYGVATVQASI